MTESPVISSTLTAIISVVVLLVTTLSGLTSEKAEDTKTLKILKAFVDPFPTMLLVVGLVCGASGGIYMRTNDMLGRKTHATVQANEEPAYGLDVDKMVAKYAPYGIDTMVIVNRLLDIEIPKTPGGTNTQVINEILRLNKATADEQPNKYEKGLLFNISSTDCNTICAYSGDVLIKKLKGLALTNPGVKKLMDSNLDSNEVIDRVKKQCNCK